MKKDAPRATTTPRFVSDSCLSYLFMKNKLYNQYDYLGLISYRLNEDTCEFSLTLHRKLQFIPSPGKNAWTENEKYSQVTFLHETGHMLGLSHPGHPEKNKAAPGSEADYEIDTESLMGFGNKLRQKDFQKAFCNRISKSMKKRYNKAQGNNSSNPYEHCKKWTAK